eukprot:2124908-Rhodomonas_salina.3
MPSMRGDQCELFQKLPAHRPFEGTVDEEGQVSESAQGCKRQRRRDAGNWAGVFMIAALACLGMVAVLDLGGGTSDKGVVMLTKAHNRHAKHRGNKYSDELSALAKRAGPDRRQVASDAFTVPCRVLTKALLSPGAEELGAAEVEERRQGGPSEGRLQEGRAGGAQVSFPFWTPCDARILTTYRDAREMEQLAHRRAHTGRASTVGGLGALERSHGIKSSKVNPASRGMRYQVPTLWWVLPRTCWQRS